MREAALARIAPFRLSEFQRDRPGISRELIKRVLRQMKAEGLMIVEDAGPALAGAAQSPEFPSMLHALSRRAGSPIPGDSPGILHGPCYGAPRTLARP